MSANSQNDNERASADEIAGVNSLRHGLLALHKTLLDAERLRYEREHGRMEGGGQMLQLLAFDPAFAWLRVISALIVQIDERLDDKEHPLTSDDVKKLRLEARGLLVGKEGGAEFQESYHRALQSSPDAVIAQSRVTRSLV
jgi:hypothetical protein